MTQTYKKKLIEVAIPLEAINAASAYEKLPGIGPHPRGIHLWWARRPHSAARSIIFAQLVDDPSSDLATFPSEAKQAAERNRLFALMEKLARWENSDNEEIMKQAKAEILKSCGGVLPPIYDPFAGGGSIPIEATRLGLPAVASDLNPVAAIIVKAMIEIFPSFSDKNPIHAGPKEMSLYGGLQGLSEDYRQADQVMGMKLHELDFAFPMELFQRMITASVEMVRIVAVLPDLDID